MTNYLNLIFFGSVLCIGLVHSKCNFKDYAHGQLNFERRAQKYLVDLKTIDDYSHANQTIVDTYYSGKDDAELKSRKNPIPAEEGHHFCLYFDENDSKGNDRLEKITESMGEEASSMFNVETGKLTKKDGKDGHLVKFLMVPYTENWK